MSKLPVRTNKRYLSYQGTFFRGILATHLIISKEVIKIRGKAIIDFDIDYDQKSVLLTERKQKLKRIIFKTCRKCGEKKPVLRFSIDRRSKNGITNICKSCLNLASLDYYYHNWEIRLAIVKQYDKEHKEQKRLYSENYREDHSEHLQKEAKIYYRKNRKRIKKRDLKRLETSQDSISKPKLSNKGGKKYMSESIGEGLSKGW